MTDYAAATAHADEINLLAACLNGYDPRNTGITPDDFDQPAHGAVWQAMLRILDDGREIDPGSVYAALGPKADGAWILEIYGLPVVPANAPSFAARVRRTADLRGLQDLARGMMQRTLEDLADPGLVAAWVRDKLEVPTGTVRLTETFADALPRVIDQVERGQQAGLSTPWPDLDRKIHGLSDGRLYVVGGRPGGGKSLAGQNLAWHWAHRHGLPVYFASLEMTADDITTRTLAQVAQVALDALLTGKMEERDWDRVGRTTAAMTSAPVHICTDTGQTVDTIRNGARQLQRRIGLGLVVVDYLQLVRPRDMRMTRREQVDEIARGLKLMAGELGVPVVAMTQLNREGARETRPPALSDLRESGEIEQAADVVILLHRPEPDQPEVGQMYVAKARNGSLGPVDVVMRTWYASIDSMGRAA